MPNKRRAAPLRAKDELMSYYVYILECSDGS
jgi:hypothetical protein